MAKQTRVIDGITFKLEPVGGWMQIPLLHSLTTMLGGLAPMLAQGIAAKSAGKKLIDAIDVKELLSSLPTFLERANPAKLREMLEMLLDPCDIVVRVKGKPSKELRLLDVFETEMQGKIGTIFKLAAWAVEVNFADFLSGLRAAADAKSSVEVGDLQPSNPDSTPSETTPPAAG